jgi:SsrA-binding protein
VAKKKKKPEPEGIETIADNRRARRNWAITETWEAGLQLTGTEVKSLRARHMDFTDAYAIVIRDEVFLIGLVIEPYSHGTHENHDRDRTRKLLLNRGEIDKITKLTKERGYSIIPLKLYFKHGWAKVLIGAGKGKSDIDKRQDIKARDADREAQRAMRRH